ncbi:MAG: coenzyme F420-0:L-glutamate ligase [Actinobacteria bacterium]|nr:coenzyme F420-0:L-glutamate ligase [Actinomycetota bacterium]
MSARLEVLAVPGIGEIAPGTDLAVAIGDALLAADLAPGDGDILCVTSKVISKARGLVAGTLDKRAAVAEQTVRVVAERMTATGVTRIVEGRHGVVMAGAGVDASNTGPEGQILLLPDDPDAAASDLLAGLTGYFRSRLGRSPDLGIVVSDTAGRAWRGGQTDFALGAAGVRVLEDYRGRLDADGRPMEVTAVAVADEIAAAADLVKGKVERVPVALVRGLAHLVRTRHDTHHFTAAGDAPPSDPRAADVGARRLIRTGRGDFFAMGHIEGVRAALGVPPGTDVASRAGIRSVTAESLGERLQRALRVALDNDPGGPAPVQAHIEHAETGDALVTLHGTEDYAMGRARARLEVALWSESLTISGTSGDALRIAAAGV